MYPEICSAVNLAREILTHNFHKAVSRYRLIGIIGIPVVCEDIRKYEFIVDNTNILGGGSQSLLSLFLFNFASVFSPSRRAVRLKS